MNKIPRFMREYANYCIRIIQMNDTIKEDFKEKHKEKVIRVLSIYEKGLVTVNEAMQLINDNSFWCS